MALDGMGLRKTYAARHRGLRQRDRIVALTDVDIQLETGRTVAVVGESGSGKSTLGRLLLGLDRPDAGTVSFDGVPLHRMNRRQRIDYRRSVQAVFQDPTSSLNPRLRVRDALREPLDLLTSLSGPEKSRRMRDALAQVGLPESALDLFPHEFSGGQRQRIVIARAIGVRPRVVVMDEPVSALDVSVRAQVLNLLLDLRDALGLGYMMITHDIATVRAVADTMLVMREGEVVERGSPDDVLDRPRHPYTRTLIDAVPDPGRRSA